MAVFFLESACFYTVKCGYVLTSILISGRRIMNEKQEKIKQLALDILKLSRNTVLVNFRFLDVAISQFEYTAQSEGTIMCDGKNLVYNPLHILKTYKDEKEKPVRDYLHMVFHCIFRHMFVDPNKVDRRLWNLASDIAVESVLTDLGLSAIKTKSEQVQKEYLAELEKDLNVLTAEKIYKYLLEGHIEPSNLEKMEVAFLADDHAIWYMALAPDLSSPETDAADDTREAKANEALRKAMEALWQDIANQVQVDLETFGKDQGLGSSNLTKNLAAVNREKYDYTAFLKKFAVLDETMQINDDEFDYIFYTYGMELYDNMPLIEPLEYKETKQIKEFVVAIDTSGSTSAELVQKFVQKTYNVLKSTESFSQRINLHIIQCDDKIQEDVKITSQGEFDQYMEHLSIKGLGGTDFRPVFACLEEKLRAREFQNLKGLIYFTDGYGEFPSKKPPYDTAFVYVDEDYSNPKVPPWAMKLVLSEEDIYEY